MAKRGKIERAGVEADVLAWSQQGLGSRAIAKKLAKERGLVVSHVSVARFLTEEVSDRERARRVSTAKAAAELAGKAGEDADDNLARLRSLIAPLLTMGLDAVRRVKFPEGATLSVNPDDESFAAQQLAAGLREWWEPIEAKDQIRAASVARELLAYMVELAGANPRPTDPKNLEAIRAAIADVFGYSTQPKADDPQEAPLTPEEHQPPVVH